MFRGYSRHSCPCVCVLSEKNWQNFALSVARWDPILETIHYYVSMLFAFFWTNPLTYDSIDSIDDKKKLGFKESTSQYS